MRSPYLGRLAPSPTGLLHLGHAATFWIAYQRVRSSHGTLRLRIEDLDTVRAKPYFTEAIFEDLAWLGIEWQPPVLYQSSVFCLSRHHLCGALRAASGQPGPRAAWVCTYGVIS